MSDEASHPFTPGTEVIVQRDYSHYGEGTFKPDTVLKLHKTGRFTLASDPSAQWVAKQSSWEAEKPWFAYPTSGRRGYSIYSTRLRLSDDAARAEYETAKAKKDHEKRCSAIAKAFSNPAKLSYEVSTNVLALIPQEAFQ